MNMLLAILFNKLMQHRSSYADGGYTDALLQLGSVAKGLKNGNV